MEADKAKVEERSAASIPTWAKNFGNASFYELNANIDRFASLAMILQALRTDRTLHFRTLTGNSLSDLVKGDEPVERMNHLRQLTEERFKSLGMRLLYVSPAWKGADSIQVTAVSDDGGLTLDANSRSSTLTALLYNDEMVRRVVAMFSELLIDKPAVEEGRVYMLTMSGGGYQFQPVGAAGVDFVVDNYAPDVVDNFKHVLDDIALKEPCGRLTIINGPPGGGKTFLMRSMLKLVKEGACIIVPPKTVAQLGDPAMIPMMLTNTSQFPNGRMVFLVEDADDVLVPRDAGNIHLISGLLNATDGIFGSVFDIRVVCTTNSPATKIDEALRRPGRLCRRFDVGKLSAEQANRVYRRLTGSDVERFKVPTLLAEVYAVAKTGNAERGGDAKQKTAGFKTLADFAGSKKED